MTRPIEWLESRLLLCTDAVHDHAGNLLGSFGVPTQPMPQKPGKPTKRTGLSVGLAFLPDLNSNPGATAQLYLDFDGADPMSWGGSNVPATPAYTTDGDANNFSMDELANIQQIWARVAEAYSPFNINVTTVDPGNLDNQVTTRVVIGGNGSWLPGAGGVAMVGGFYNGSSNICWVFSALFGSPKTIADAAEHESGHTFGLLHQSKYSGSTKTAEYSNNNGSTAKAPIMGVSYYATRSLWWNGQSSQNSSTIQNDVNVISNANNNFGYRADDHGGTPGTATAMTVDGSTATGAGVIETITDKEYFSFSTLTGDISFTVSPAAAGGMLDATLALVNSSGTTITSANTTSLGETINASVSAGQYFLMVASKGSTGDIGQYTLSGTIVTNPNFVAAPANVTATASNGAVSLTWTDMSWNEVEFSIERSDDGGSIFSQVGTTGANTAAYSDADVDVGSTYIYRIKAISDLDESNYSSTASATMVPATPSGLSATTESASGISLDWNDVTGETGYRVDRSLNGTTWATLVTLDADVSGYDDTSLSAATKYSYRVVALHSAGNSPASSSVNATTLAVAPASLTGSATPTAVTLSWTNVAGETGYKVEKSANGTDWSVLSSKSANNVSHTDGALSTNTTYYYRVRAVNAGGDSAASPTLTITTKLPAPTGLAGSVISTSQINLSWNDSTGETGYRVERLIGTTWTAVGEDLDADTTSLNVAELTAGTTYAFRVSALGPGGVSPASSTYTGTTIPPAPASLTLSALSTSQIKLTWTNVTGETGYKVERSTNGVDWTQIASTAVNVAAYTSSLLGENTVYHYRVRAFRTEGDGNYTDSASTRTLLSAPTGMTATATSTTQINLSWNDSSGETGYRVERLSGTNWVQLGENLDADDTDLSITGLIAGTAYSYRVRAINSGGLSGSSNTATATTIPPAAGSVSVVSLSDTSIKVTFGNVTGEAGFKVERSPDGSDWTQIGTTGANILAYTDTALTSDSVYHYRVKPYNTAGTAEASSSANTRTLLVAPSGLSADVFSATRIDLSWQDMSTETGFKVEKLSGTSWVQVGATLAADTTQLQVTGLTPGTSYSFRVRAVNSGGTSAGSTTAIATTIPPAPTLSGTVFSSTQINLSWTNVAGETGYKIERSSDGSEWTEIATKAVNVVTHSDTALEVDTSYQYRVRAYNAAGDSDYGALVTRRTLLDTPTGLAGEATSATQVHLSWDNSTGETGYKIERLSGASWVQVGSVLGVDVTETTVTGLSGGTSYSFRVRASNEGGFSAGGTPVSITTRPTAPTSISAALIAADAVKLTWSNVTGETGFRIEGSTNGTDFTEIATVGMNVLSYTDAGLMSGTYYYRIKAYNASGDSIAGPTVTRVV
jgi:titin